ncbi:MAG: Kelch repeat-containing protein [Acidimicrobiia bacterium]
MVALAGVAGVGRLTGAGPAGTLHTEEAGQPVTFDEAGSGAWSAPAPSVRPLSTGWRLVRTPPVSTRERALSTWTGEELLIWGGSHGLRAAADGAAYRPDIDQWRPLAPSPLRPRDAAVSAWTGREWILWGGILGDRHLDDGAAYDPGTDSWRLLPPSPIGAASHALAVWTGREVLVWGGSGGPEGVAYDPVADRWRRLPPAQSPGFATAAVWTGEEMVVWAFDGAMALDPGTNRWRRLATPPVTPWMTQAVVWTGTEMIGVGGATHDALTPAAAALDPRTNRWRTLAAAPEPVDVTGVAATWTGRLLVVSRGPSDLQVYDPTRDSWAVMPGISEGRRDDAVAAWTGEEMIFWGGNDPFVGTPAAREEGFAWRPRAR